MGDDDLRQEIDEIRKEQRARGKRRQEEAPAEEPQVYVVQPGDSLSKIAKAVYGDANRWKEIFEANKEQLTDPNLIRPGQELRIP
jgi:nucleoid-associated protein YgaU